MCLGMKEQVTGDVSEHSSVQGIEYEESNNSVDRRMHQKTGRGRSCGCAGASLSSLLPLDWTAIPSELCAVESEASSLAVTSIVESHAESVECRGEGNLQGISYQDMASPSPQRKFPHLKHQSRSLCFLVTPVQQSVHFIPLAMFPPPIQSEEERHTQAQSACIASVPTAPLSCILCTPVLIRPFSWFLPSCGTPVSFDLHNLIVYGHNDAFLARIMRPVDEGLC